MTRILRLNDGWVDLGEGDVHRRGPPTRLTAMELELLAYLASRPGQTIERAELLEQVWGYSRQSRTRTVAMTLRRLREKIEVDPSAPVHVVTVTGRGVRFEPVAATDQAPMGRDAVLIAVASARGSGAVITLTGPGGIGKTTVARSITATEPAVAVDARGIQAAAQLVDAIAGSLGVATSAEGSAEVREALHHRGHLLVVDDADALNDHAIAVLADLARGGDVIVTSRHPLGTSHEIPIPVPPLDPSTAARLLERRLEERRRGWSPNEAERMAIAAVARGVDGHPLAIELAAARADLVGLERLAERLPERLDWLADTSQPRRDHRVLVDLIDGSLAALTDTDRTALRALCALPGPFDLDRAEAVAGVGAIDAIARLVDHGLVTRTAEADHPPRFRVLDVIRARVVPDPTAGQRFDAWLIQTGLPHAWGVFDEEPTATEAAASLLPDILARFDHAEGLTRARLVLVAQGPMYHRGRLALLAAMHQAVADTPGLPRAEAALLALFRGLTLRRLGQPREAASALDQVLADPTDVPLPVRLDAATTRAACEVDTDPRRAIALSDAVVAKDEHPTFTGMAHLVAGHAHKALGEFDAAAARYRAGLALLADGPIRWRVGARVSLASLDVIRGRLPEAEDAFRAALADGRSIGDRHADVVIRTNLGAVMLYRGAPEAAAEHFAYAAREAARLGRRRTRVTALNNLGRALWHAGDPDGAARRMEEAIDLASTPSLARHRVWFRLFLAAVQADRGRLGAAADAMAGIDPSDAPALAALANALIAVAEGRWEDARHHHAELVATAGPELAPEVTHVAARVGGGSAPPSA